MGGVRGGLKAVGVHRLTPESESHLAPGVWRDDRKGIEERDEIQ